MREHDQQYLSRHVEATDSIRTNQQEPGTAQ
jgi:hypothetical protein